MRYLYAVVIAMLISNLALGAEVRKITQEDIEWGDPSTTVTSPGGHVGHRIDNTFKLSAPWVDVRVFMDGLSGRPTLAAWKADQVNNQNPMVDTTKAIQAAIDNALQSGISTVYLASGVYRTTDTIQLNYGIGFTSCNLVGSGIRENAEGGFGGTAIVVSFGDRPAIAIQGSRHSGVRDLTIIGVNEIFVANTHAFGGPDCDIDDTDPFSWLGPNLDNNALGRYSIYAGIAIDPYSGPQPAIHYPDVTYPSWLGAVSQYNKSYSSAVKIKNVQIRGFVAAVAIQPCDADGNGDFTAFEDISFSFNIYGIAIGNGQSRNVNVYGSSAMSNYHTALTGTAVGRKIGVFGGTISGVSFGWGLNVASIPTGFGGITFVGCYSENQWRLGDFTSGITGNSVTFVNCYWNLFMVRYPHADYVAPRGTPLNHVSGGFLTFSGGHIETDMGFISSSAANYQGTSFGMMFLRSDGQKLPNLDTCPDNVFKRFTGNTLGKITSLVERNSTPTVGNTIWGYSSSVGKYIMGGGAIKLDNHGRLKYLPVYFTSFDDTNDPQHPSTPVIGTVLMYNLDKSASSGSLSGIIWTFTDPYYSSIGAYLENAYPISPGDYILDESTATYWLVYEKTGAVCKAIALNGYYWDGSSYAMVASVGFSPTTEYGDPIYTGSWANSGNLFGDVTAGSDNITNIGGHDGNYNYHKAEVGDYMIWMGQGRSPWPGRILRINAIDNTNHIYTVSQTATYSIAGQPIMWYYTK